MVDPVLLDQARHLAPSERLELISALWESIEVDNLPVSPQVGALIDERLAEATASPLQGQSWEDVESELRSRLT